MQNGERAATFALEYFSLSGDRVFKKLGPWVLGIVLAAVFFEALAATLLWMRSGEFPYYNQSDASPIPVEAFHVADAVFQPYMGYVLRATREGDYLNNARWRTNNRGFHNLIDSSGVACCDYPYLAQENELVIGIFGGSVGSGYALSAQISGSFQALANSGRWVGKKIRVLNFALPGYKQPQQEMALAYFLNLGQKFDIVINIDGFNEAVTTFRNWKDGVEPTYPADTLWGAWGRQLEISDAPTAEKSLFVAGYHRLSARESRQAAQESFFASLKLMHKAIAGWHEWRRSVNAADAQPKLNKRAFFPTAQISPLPPGDDIWHYTAARWLQSSITMADLAHRAGAVYLHLLQPNQWDKATGTYLPRDPNHPYGWVLEPINKVYPLLRAQAVKLGEAEVDFLDVSRIFQDSDSREYYADDCCHYTQSGNERIFAATISALKKYANQDQALPFSQ